MIKETILKFKTWALAALFLSSPGLVMAQTHPLQSYINGLQSFSANFVQEREEDHFFRVERAKGTFDLVRPGKMRWDYHEPDEQHIVVDGRHLWVYDLELQQVSVRPVSDIQGDIPLAWLLFDEPIEQSYKIIDVGQRDGLTWYNLQPKDATFFQSIEIGLKDDEMREVWMYQSSDNVTKVKFSQVRINQPISPRAFNFTPPQGTDLVGEM